MKILLLYLIIGFITYPALMDMWYRIAYKRKEFYCPSFDWYFGFIISVWFWPIVIPVQIYQYIREMKK